MKRRIAFIAATLVSAVAFAATQSPPAGALMQGRFDNGAQVAKGAADAAHATPHVTVTIEPTAKPDWSFWHVHIQTDPESTFDQTWAMQARTEHDGSHALIPYYQFKQESEPTAATFDPNGWLSLEACALRGKASATRMEGFSEGEPCVAVSMSVGARRALLPVGFMREGDALQLDMNLRSVRTRIDAVRSP